MTEPATFIVDHADVPGLRDAVAKLVGAGYSESFVTERLGLEDLAHLQWRHRADIPLGAFGRRDRLALAIDLFLLQGALRRTNSTVCSLDPNAMC
jgi:hypothetical protein